MDELFLTRMLAMECREDAVTEVFASLLEVPLLRHAFLARVLEADAFAGAALKVNRQYENKNARGIPDVALEGDDVFVLIENKLGAPLTANQPCQYFEEVRLWKREVPHGHAYLVIQAPEKRIAVLSKKCDELLAASCAASLSEVAVRYISWERTAAVFRAAPVDDVVVAFIRDNFSKLVADAASRTSAPLTKEHVLHLSDPDVLDALSALQKLLADLDARARRDDDFEVKAWWDFADVSIEIWPRGDKSRAVFVVCSFDAGRRLGAGPLWLQLSGAAYNRPWVKARLGVLDVHLSPPEPNWVEGDITPLELRPNEDPPDQCERLWTRIVGVVAAAGSPEEALPSS